MFNFNIGVTVSEGEVFLKLKKKDEKFETLYLKLLKTVEIIISTSNALLTI